MPDTTHPVMLMPGDERDADRLAAAINTVRMAITSERFSLTAARAANVNKLFAARVLAALDADGTVDALIDCGCEGHGVDAGLRIELEHVRRTRDAWRNDVIKLRTELVRRDRTIIQQGEQLADADRFGSECYRIVGEVNGHRDAGVLAALAELPRRAELAEQQRDQWIARTVRANDALIALRRELAALVAEHVSVEEMPTDTAEAAPPASVSARPRDTGQPRCARANCGRGLATHQLIHDHSFVRPGSPFFMGGRSDG